MSERIDIVNMALGFLGVKPISSIDDDGVVAEQATIQYVPARDATLEAHDWSFAIERFTLAPLVEVPVYGAAKLFKVPVNILRVIACDDPGTSIPSSPGMTVPINSREQIDWVLEGGNIVCNEEVVFARGVRRIEDEGSFSPLFVEAFAAKLAMVMAIALASSADIQARVAAYYATAISEAKSRDGLQGRSQRIRSRRVHKAR